MPRSAFALFSPSSWDWLNDLSLKWPTSLTSATVTFLPPFVVVVPPFPDLLLLPPQPAASSASVTASAATSGDSQYFPLNEASSPMPDRMGDANPPARWMSRQE